MPPLVNQILGAVAWNINRAPVLRGLPPLIITVFWKTKEWLDQLHLFSF